MKSLPPGSFFEIISFGSSHEYMNVHGQTRSIAYNDQTSAAAISQIERMSADFGGTEITNPLRSCAVQGKNQRIFVLTDGQVHDRYEVENVARNVSEHSRIYSLGIGSGADEQLCQNMAKAGRGACSMVPDGNNEKLNSCVVQSLQKSSQPSLPDCVLQISGVGTENMGELFRNTLVTKSFFLTKSQLENFSASFKSRHDPVTKAPLEVNMSKQDFTQVTETDQVVTLFKMAGHEAIQKLSKGSRAGLSVQYQVLSSDTSLVGVIKQKNKETGELQTHSETFGVQAPVEQKPQPAYRGQLIGGFGGSAMSASRQGAPLFKSLAAPQRAMQARAMKSKKRSSMMESSSDRSESSSNCSRSSSPGSGMMMRSACHDRNDDGLMFMESNSDSLALASMEFQKSAQKSSGGFLSGIGNALSSIFSSSNGSAQSK